MKGPTALPTGTVTFLFSDIEGSTKRWEAHHDAMKAAVARHDDVVRTAIAAHGGYVFKTGGDAFCAAFPTAPSAVRAAIDVQRGLASEDFSAVDGLRVRVGLHTGYAEERDADYFGPAVNRVMRLMSIGHGEQILMSAATHALVQHETQRDASFADLGTHRLKDLAQPEHVWQLMLHGLRNDFPPLRSLDTLPNNLPVQVTSFRGRERDLEGLKESLAAHRLVTLIGAGGVGKTRLATQLAAEVLDQFSDGVWVADLAPITEPDLVPVVVAKALGISASQLRIVDESVTDALRHKQMLLVLDNCEHLLESAAGLADAIHRHCAKMCIVATSRQPLGVGGEKVVRLSSLAVPEKASELNTGDALEFGAVALFVDRASLVDESFRLADDNVPIVCDICRRLDGIPLAIELAAARVKVMSIPNLASRLNERFALLTGGSRTALPRQRTLAALFDWSYDLLEPAERMLFARAGVFAGSFTLDAATAVCGKGSVGPFEVLDLIASLADKSLVNAETGGGLERYRMLECTRQYALEKLAASGERERIMRSHAEYYRTLARDAEKTFGSSPLGEWLCRVELDQENFRAAIDWALSKGGDPALAGDIAASLEMFWWHGGAEAEGARWIDGALCAIDQEADPEIASRLRNALGLIMSRMMFS
ncbi:MAG TPA: adenylate/guanylate cyclase domain-containing protein [Candidatus Eremiobacteraceae bacterium]|nr:adenylate/guanylate cyclase domain-containing protein [Candidatus Eremiobacteraceae bacterium]